MTIHPIDYWTKHTYCSLCGSTMCYTVVTNPNRGFDTASGERRYARRWECSGRNLKWYQKFWADWKWDHDEYYTEEDPTV